VGIFGLCPNGLPNDTDDIERSTHSKIPTFTKKGDTRLFFQVQSKNCGSKKYKKFAGGTKYVVS
jgi:hypothetical protein